MRVVVFSDSHGDYSALEQAALEQPEAEVFLHLGDGDREFQRLAELFPDKLMRGVAGNCDWAVANKRFDTLTCEGVKIFFAHGHTFGVKAGTERLLAAAKGHDADVVLYGHTHQAQSSYENGVYLMNPGSVSRPRVGPPSYGVIDITPAGIVVRVVVMPGWRE